MSRRRVSVKDLGASDCQGWLLRRKGGRSFLGSKWKRYWFVLKKSSLYWYANQMAEKAEGFINLSGFTIQQARQGRKKHALTASHPLVVTIFIAAESFADMNKWISKLSEAAEPCDQINAEECYSEGSDQDADECVTTSCSLNAELQTADSDGDVSQPLGESSPCTSTPPASPTSENRRRSTLEGGTLSRNRGGGRRRASSEGGERLSWLDPAGLGGASLPLIHVGGQTEDEDVHEKPADEMESLYNDLKAASLSPIGQSSRRDFRASFVRRCQNDKVNEKLHLLRILQSTLKAKESELLAVEQIVTGPTTRGAQQERGPPNAVLAVAQPTSGSTGALQS
ncbi:interactor protein for cytohesin exchange factors 1 [Etheostoma spectabile]|uniref:interactor protein for cytohesin exchange factors 1 n=1 Tax=Etheostoma spectabile TaxID=54343 RepID=UPI0013AF22BD|nr:interactor protein for cytohesin exchange factors 1-like [Etheostoma spectabile]XP_032399732.1 interactor protein for cytohesin exchange factors 1-like [Etheostoma spectabile]